MEEATTIPPRKPGKSDYSNPSAYRPIALLNTLGKALEAVVTRCIRYAVEAYDLLPETQMRARRGRSTKTALHLLVENICAIWVGNKPRIASILSLDVVGALDRVSHARLAHNLRKRKIPETFVRWIEGFLKDRYTEIRIADFTLKRFNVKASIKIGTKEIRPAQDIRVPGLRVDSALKMESTAPCCRDARKVYAKRPTINHKL
jgi:hypothetical protein